MPNYFTLTKIGNDKPSAFNDIDIELCEHFNTPVDDVRYFMEWYDTIGLALAMGKTWDEMNDIFKGSNITLEIIAYLRKNYTADAWYQHR